MSILHIESEQQFEQEILNSDCVSLLDFYADWCVPCKMQAPILEDLAKETEDVIIAKINVDNLPAIAGDYNISSIPTLMTFKNGEIVSQISAVQTKEALEEMIATAKNA